MSKDPAFLFYSGDFVAGVIDLDFEQKGKYIMLLCTQHLKGHLTEKQVKMICNGFDVDVMAKFIQDDEGLYYNVRLEEEVLKRQRFTQSRANNRKGKFKSASKNNNHKKNTSKTYEKHMENENVNINTDINKDTKGGVGEKEIFRQFIAEFNRIRQRDYKGNDKVAGQLHARINDGYTLEQVLQAVKNCHSSAYHLANPNFLTPEFITRKDKLEQYLNWVEPAEPVKPVKPKTDAEKIASGELTINAK